jgi:hypothetical protein
MTNGCSGDVNNIDIARPRPSATHPFAEIQRVAEAIAAEAWDGIRRLGEADFASAVDLRARVEMIPFDCRGPTREQIDDARLLLGAERWNDREWIYAREIALMAAQPAEREVPLQVMRIGDLGVVGLPGEPFAEIGLAIKRRSPFPQTLVIGLANAYAGYVAPDQAMDEGGYETRLCRHSRAAHGTAKLWSDSALRHLREIGDQPARTHGGGTCRSPAGTS